MIKNSANKIRLSAIFTLLASFLCCFIIALTGLTFTANATSVGGTQLNLGNTGITRANASDVQTLMRRIAGNNTVTTYDQMSTALGTNVRNSTYFASGANQTNISLGGLTWNIAYVSRDRNDNVIATLWLADTITDDGQNSVQWSKWSQQSTDFAYPSNMYSSSFVRSQLMGTPYVSEAGNAFLSYATAAPVWQTLRDNYGAYIVTPADVAYQETESGAVYNGGWTAFAPNECYGVPSTGVGESQLTSDYLTANPKEGYADWKYDQLWVPSASELGSIGGKSGIWATTTAMRQGSSDCWTRTTRTATTTGVYFVNSSTGEVGVGVGVDTVASSRSVRPAFHLNLKSVYNSANAVGELVDGNTKQVNETTLNALYAAVNAGTAGNSYESLKETLGKAANGVLSSADIRANNGGNDVKVTLGGLTWYVTYLSKDKTGNVIATLWLSDVTNAYNQNGVQFNKWTSEKSSYAYPANMYSSSYARNQLTGTQYAATEGASELSSGAPSYMWQKFTSNFGNYFVAPSQISWQANESTVETNAFSFLAPNEAYGVPSQGGWYVNGEINMNYTGKPGYTDWSDDLIWLPSISETGGHQGAEGIWKATSAMRGNTYNLYSATRSGYSAHSARNYRLNSAGNSINGVETDIAAAVRPAIHFNLTRAEGEEPVLDLAELWNSAVQESLDNNGAEPVEFLLPENWYAQPHETFGTSFGEGVGFDNGRLLVPEKANIRIRLNGRKIDRNLLAPQSKGNVIVIDGGKLEIVDRTTDQSGSITGGYNAGAGGGIRVERGGELVLSSGRITGNISSHSQYDNTLNYSGGGGVFLTGQMSFDTVVPNDEITASPVANALTTKFTMNGGYIADNKSIIRGGGICALYKAEITINGGKIINNRLNMNGDVSSYYGGGAYFVGAEVNMYSGAVSGGNGYNGGGFYVNTGSTFNMYGGEISGNEAVNTGAGVSVYQSDMNMYGGLISENVSAYMGGGIGLHGGPISSNNSSTNGINFYMYGGEIVDNYSGQYGGALYTYNLEGGKNGGAVINGGAIRNNKSGVRGGAGYFGPYSRIEINDLEVSGNVAETNAGGIYVYQSELIINGGNFHDNVAEGQGGAFYNNTGYLEINGGKISNNISKAYGGAIYAIFSEVTTMYRTDTILNINGGEISGNTAVISGGGIYTYNTVKVELNGGEISGNTANGPVGTDVFTPIGGGGIFLSYGGELIMHSGKIINNRAVYSGGGVYVYGSSVEMYGGEISGNDANKDVSSFGGGGLIVRSLRTYDPDTSPTGKSTFTMYGGSITDNTSDWTGGGIMVYRYAEFTMNGGVIARNKVGMNNFGGGGVFVDYGSTFVLNSGDIIRNNVDGHGGGIYIYAKSHFYMNGGRIVENSAAIGGGLYFENNTNNTAFYFSRGIIARNALTSGASSNVMMNSALVNIIGKLRGDGYTSYVGITGSAGVFTSNYKTYNPNISPLTYFFSDNTEYRITQNSAGEAVLSTADSVERRTLIWEYSTDGGATWHDINTTYFRVPFTGADYTVRGRYNNTVVISAPTSSSLSDAVSLPSEFSAIGSYGYTVENTAGATVIYANPTLIFEIIKVTLEWQYSTDNGATWQDVKDTVIYYTGKEYKFRAMNPVSGTAVALKNDLTLKNVGKSVLEIADSVAANYENGVLEFEILRRTLSFVWDFDGSSGIKDGAYYWNYDAVSHSPVFVVNGIDDNELVGNIGLEAYYTIAGTDQILSGVPVNAGRYTVHVRFSDDSPFHGDDGIVFVNEEQTYYINPLIITAGWRDETDAPVNEVSYIFNGSNRSVSARLYGLRSGDNVEPVIEYYLNGKKLSSEPVNVGIYTARVSLPENCVNYVLGDNYSCQMDIVKMTVTPAFAGNANNNNQFVWTFSGSAQAPVVTLLGANSAEIPFTVKYAEVLGDGMFGEWLDEKPVNAANYVVRVFITDQNYSLSGSDRQFRIAPMGVTVSWSGRTENVEGVNGTRGESGAIEWTYDGLGHYLTATARPVSQIIIDGSTVSLDLDVTGEIINEAGTENATASLKTEHSVNFYFVDESQCKQAYGINKFVITSVKWERTVDGNVIVNNSSDRPHYVYGTVTGANGPGFSAKATGINNTVITLDEVYYSAQFGDGENWAANSVNGYTAYADIPADIARNYKFADNISSENNHSQTFIIFFIDPITGDKTTITPTWIVYNDDSHTSYKTLAEFGGDKFTFTYDGTSHKIYAVYIESGAIVEELDVVYDGEGVDAGAYNARLLPSDKYDYSGKRDCAFEVLKRKIVITWTQGKFYYDKTEKKPVASVSYYVDGGEGEAVPAATVGLTVQGAVNAGPHTAMASVNANYEIVSGATFDFEIGRVSFGADDIDWEENATFVYDGNQHAPKATFKSPYDGDLTLKVIGSSSVGTHWAIAALDDSNLLHNNYYIRNPEDATCEFKIVRVTVTDVKWSYEENGDDITDNNPAVYTYNGKVQGPVAYFIDNEGVRHNLEVNGRMTNAGSYVVYVTADYDFGSKVPSMSFVINPRQLSVVWNNTLVDYTGSAQSPKVTFNDLLTGDPVTDDFAGQYTLSSYTNAGVYNAQLHLTNGNYTFVNGSGVSNTLIHEFTISKLVVSEAGGLGWSSTVSWVYDGAEHAPELGFKDGYTYLLGTDEVEFTFGYNGVTSYAGSHTVTAYILSAMWNGRDIAENFIIADAISSRGYTITSRPVTVDWDWTGAEKDGDVHFWYYNGTAQGPAAYMLDDDGNRITDGTNPISLTVFGKGINVLDQGYTVTVNAPENYVFVIDGDEATVATAHYYIRKANITVVWAADGVENEDYTIENGVFVWTYDGNEHAPKAYIYDADKPDNLGAQLMVTGGAVNAQTSAYTAYAAQNNGNYTIVSGASQQFIIRELPVYILWYGNNGSLTDFEWEYDANNTDGFKPDAYLAVKDENGDLVRLRVDGEYVKLTVTGAMSQVCQGDETYTATAVDLVPNYTFAADAQVEQEFKIVPMVLTSFTWNANGATAELVDGIWVYTFVYDGTLLQPLPQTSYPFEFVTTVKRVNSDGTLGDVVLASIDAGTYQLETAPQDGNYAVPAGSAVVRVVITPREAQVQWSGSEFVYNGLPQAPEAYYTDVNGEKIVLNVTVTGEHVNAGKSYSAKAEFKETGVTNYTLTSATKTYAITQREIPVSWTWSSEWNNKTVEYDGNEHAPVPVPSLGNAFADDVVNGNLTITYNIAVKGGATLTGLTAKNAGEYIVKNVLGGAKAGNYKLKNGEETFTISRKSLTITSDALTIPYGSPVPVYTATFSGFVDGEEQDFDLNNPAISANWISCVYTSRTVPGQYPIKLNKQWLENKLSNYSLTLQEVLLTVEAVSRTVIWQGKLDNDFGAEYDGVAYKPTAFYYNDGSSTPIPLNVVYASYDETTGEYTRITDPSYAAIEAGTYYALAVDANGTVQLQNAGVMFRIHKRKITVNISSVDGDVFGKVYKRVYETGDEVVVSKYLVWDYADKKPVLRHDLEIELSCEFLFDEYGFAHAGKYMISGSWNSEDFGNNYEVIFAGEGEDADGNNVYGVYEIVKAEISINKRDDIMSEDEFFLGHVSVGNPWYIRLGETSEVDGLRKYTFIGHNGYQGADIVNVYYSDLVYNLATETVPDPSDEAANAYQSVRRGISKVGKYAINYKIEIPNHETLYGTWRVLILPEDQVARIIFSKDFEIEYGKNVPENFATYLLDEGYITVETIGVDEYRHYATAYVSDGKGNRVNSFTGVGRYTIEVEINMPAGSTTEYHISYHAINQLDDTNVGRYVITPKKLVVEWGVEASYDYQAGVIHMPSPNVFGWVTANTLNIGAEQIKTKGTGTEYEYSAFRIMDNGQEVTILVAASGNFTDEGGHTLRMYVENSNYEISDTNDVTVVTIIDRTEIPPTLTEGLPGWLLWVLIAAGALLLILIIIILVLASRRNKGGLTIFGGYDEGFGDDTDEYSDDLGDGE